MKRLSNHGSPIQKWSGFAMNPYDVCLIETDGKTTKRLRDREISRPQSRSSFQKQTCLRWREAQSRKRTMKIAYLLAALLLVPSFATQAAIVRTNESGNRAHVGTRPAVGSRLQGYRIEGREIVAPPWSFACMNDQGPQQCDEPMWVYGSPDYLAQFKNAF
jgi:hypothetical protein